MWKWPWSLDDADDRPREPLTELGRFRVGQVVKHKINGESMVIIALSRVDVACKMPHGDTATVSIGTQVEDEFGIYLAEVEPVTHGVDLGTSEPRSE